ncbi:hypothetical protein Taro_003624, partial [Colocasia esculenta]|nr:hypothetical protein [Colocasia esculenta]
VSKADRDEGLTENTRVHVAVAVLPATAMEIFQKARQRFEHARQVHPTKRPSDVDPSRLQAWCHLEHDREIGDVLSALQSTSPNAIVIGDYVIDGNNGTPHEWENIRSGDTSRSWRTTLDLELNQLMRDPLGPINLRRSLSRSWRTNRRSGQRYLWGANLLGLQDEEDHDEFLDSDVASMQQRTHRRSRHRSLWGENLFSLQDDDDDDNNDESPDTNEVQEPQRHRRFVRPRHDADSHDR